ncbi:hypothetical protein, partial [Christiangramia aquimixticola]|uniref:hypothetical protein n=1 Tax=Christiangramia aquimixticola TaxID=1697558 RepID=UPI003AA7FEDD
MKNLKIYLAIFAMMPFLFSSCTKDESVSDTGVSPDVAVLYLGPVLEGLNQTRQQEEGDIPQCTEDEAAFASIRLTYGPNNTPVEVTVEILEDEQGLFTAYDDKLEIPVVSGNSVEITLTDFVVLNDNQDPIWMAPKLGSDFAKFVSHPLSRKFNLRAGSKNYVNVDVLCFDDRVVNMYGYQFFDITQVPLYKFCVFANYCSDSGRHFTADYEFSLYKYLGDNPENPLQPASNYQLIHEEESPVKGNDDGTYWADPLCMVIPGKPKDKGPNDPYLFYEIKLVNWAPYYATDGTFAKSGYLTWNQISDLLTVEGDDSNSTVDYWHFFFNCGDDDGPVECDINDPDADCDGDTIPNSEDQCQGADDTVDVDNDNIPDCKDDL